MQKALSWAEEKLDYEFEASEYLLQALTHRSAGTRNNERLEFLGDAILDAVISEAVYRLQPLGSEGELSRLRSSLVKDSSLAKLAAQLGIGDLLILGPGEKKAGGHRRASILADALEAVFGAVYLDSGYDAAARVIHAVYGRRLSDLPDPAELRDPKTRLQEYLQAQRFPLPDYRITEISGKAHNQRFNVSCKLSEPSLETTGSGNSRRDAEQQAADAMLGELESIST